MLAEIAPLEPHIISLEHFETFVRFVNLILTQASVFAVSLRPLPKSRCRRDDEVQRPLDGGPVHEEVYLGSRTSSDRASARTVSGRPNNKTQNT